jgi:hypothetical protein
MRCKRRHHKIVLEFYKKAKRRSDAAYPYVRHQIADAHCQVCVGKGIKAWRDLVRWQAVREVYWNRLIKMRPRGNEFFSY